MITLAGLSHHTAPLQVRERLTVPADEIPGLLQRAGSALGPAAVLATCNRFELYVSGEREPAAVHEFLVHELGGPLEAVERHFHLGYGPDAVRHLYSVASGIDSMVIGESEILGQVRGAFSATVGAGVDDAVLSRLFHTAIRVGRRARTETEIGRHALSVSSIAVQQARAAFPDLAMATVLVLGAGEAGRLAAESLVEQGVRDVLVVNRTFERAQSLAEDLGGHAAPWAELVEAMGRSDVVIGAAGATEVLVNVPQVTHAARSREGQPLLLIDIGVPRDFDPAVRDIPGVTYYDLDDLQQIADANGRLREAEVEKVRGIVDLETGRFLEWWEQLQVIPTISALNERAEAIRRGELERTMRRFATLPEADRGELEQHLDALTRAIVKQVLHDPIATLRERGDRDVYLDAVRTLFRLDHRDASDVTDPPGGALGGGEPAGAADLDADLEAAVEAVLAAHEEA